MSDRATAAPAWLDRVDTSTAEFAELYDEVSLWSAPFGLLLLEHVPLAPDLRALDVGAGTGFVSVELAQRCGAGAEIVAIDPWSAALEKLATRIAYLGLDNLRLVEATIEGADLPRGHFDLVVSNLGLNNFTDPEASLRACRDALRPGGRLVFTTNTRDHMVELYDVFRRVLVAEALDDALAALERHVQTRASEDSIVSLLETGGFESIEVVRGRFTMRYASGAAFLRHHFVRLAFLPAWLEVCPADRAVGLMRDLERGLDQVAEREGVLALSVPMLCVEAARPA